ncbi:MAG: CHRD domain-containing protein, partial [Bacteroidota bacterium]
MAILLFGGNLQAQTDQCRASGGRLITSNGTFYVPVCIDDMTEEATEITRTDFVGENSAYFLTTAAGFIVQRLEGSPPFDFRELGAGVLAVWSVSYTGDLIGAENGDNICATTSTECFNLSNPVVLNRAIGVDCDVFCNADAGTIALANGAMDTSICLINGQVDLISVNVTQPAVGDEQVFVVTSTQGEILSLLSDNGSFDFSNLEVGTCLIWQVSYNAGLSGLEVGNTPDDFIGCYSISNPITVNREAVTAGSISITPEDGGGETIDICTADGFSDGFGIILSDGIGDTSIWILTNNMGNIISIPEQGPPFDLEGAGIGQCRVYRLTYNHGLSGLSLFASIENLAGCFALSNPITVTRRSGQNCPTALVANMSGYQEAPCPATSTGVGMINALLDGNELSVQGSFSGLTSDFDPSIGGGIHLHLGYAGQAGPVAVPLSVELDDDLRGGFLLTAANQFTLTDEQAEFVRTRGAYINIHTTDFPAGELRGQLLLARRSDYKYSRLSGANVVPALSTTATGGISVERQGNTISLAGSINNLRDKFLSDTAGTVFLQGAAAGRTGDILFRLNLETSPDSLSAIMLPDSNTFELSPGQLDSLNANLLYVSVRSSFAPEGELRGQLTDLATAAFQANLSGHQARPTPFASLGNGRLIITYDGVSSIEVSGSVGDLEGTVLTELAGGSHLHIAPIGRSGGIAFPLTLNLDGDGQGGQWLPADNTFTLLPVQVSALFKREMYVNVHTTANTAGEVRGQLLLPADAYFGANLAGANQNMAAVKTTANGFLLFELCGNTLTTAGSFDDLETPFNAAIGGGAHLHTGSASSNGPVAVQLATTIGGDFLNGTYSSSNNSFQLTSEQRSRLLAGELYANIHTEGNPAGELRGQILKDDNAFPSGPEIVEPANGSTVTVFEDGNTTFNGLFTDATDPDGNPVVYVVEFTSPDTPDFSELISCTKVGTNLSSTAAFVALHEQLRTRGTPSGTEIPLLYRIVALDGSVGTPGPAASVNLIFGGASPTCPLSGGRLFLPIGGSDAISVCVGDGEADIIDVLLVNNIGANFRYVLTDENGVITLIETSSAAIDFEAFAPGEGQVWAVTFDDEPTGLLEGELLSELEGCFGLSNPITVTRLEDGVDCGEIPCLLEGGSFSLANGEKTLSICADDGSPDIISAQLEGNTGNLTGYLATDTLGNILGISLSPVFNLEGAGGGVCFLRAISSDVVLEGLRIGSTIAGLEGCFALSDSIRVTRLTGDDCPLGIAPKV